MMIFFCRGEGAVSEIIKFATLSQFSHVAIMINNVVYEATFKRGVIKSSFKDFCDRYPDRECVSIRNVNEDAAETWLSLQLGKEYDYGALYSFYMRPDWEDDKKWFCSELVAAALVKAGALKLKMKASRITPRDLWNSCKMRWTND